MGGLIHGLEARAMENKVSGAKNRTLQGCILLLTGRNQLDTKGLTRLARCAAHISSGALDFGGCQWVGEICRRNNAKAY